MAVRGQKLLDKCARMLRDCNLIEDSNDAAASLPEIVRALLATTEPGHYEFNETQADSWARCVSDLTLDRQLAVEALRLGILPTLPRYLQRYKSHETSMSGDVGWSDALISLHNFALLEDKGFPEALVKLNASDLTSIAQNLARALKPGLHPSDARDATTRLAQYEAMRDPLIDSGVLLSLAAYIPTVKPFNRLPAALWGPEALREINHTLQAMEMLMYVYTWTGREADLPIKELSSSQLTGWICDVLHGASSTDPKLKEEIEASRVAALDCLTSLLINAEICRAAVPSNRSMLFRVASAVTSTSPVALLSAAAQVLAQALSEEDLVPPSELASLHTYDLARHLSMVLEHSRDFRELLNVLAALQNILDPAHFKGNVAAMKKVAERLVACGFESIVAQFVKDPKSRYDTPKSVGEPVYPLPEDYEALVEAADGALENTRALLQAVGPITVPLLPRPVPPLSAPKPMPAPPPAAKASAEKKGRGPASGNGSGNGARKGAQNVPADVIAAVTGGTGAKRKQPAAAAEAEAAKKKKVASSGQVLGRAASSGSAGGLGAPTASAAPACCMPVADRVRLEKDMRKAAALAAPLLTGAPFRAVLDWFNEWATSWERLEQELGTDVHVDGGGHRVLLLNAIEDGDASACLDLLADILQLRLPPPKQGVRGAAAAQPPPPPAAAAAATPAKRPAPERAPTPPPAKKVAVAAAARPMQVDPPRVQVAKAEPPKAEPVKVQPPKVELPKVEAPKVEAPKVEAPKAEPPKVELPKVEPPKVEPPKVEAPKAEPPKAEPLQVEPPKAGPLNVEPSKVEPPKVAVAAVIPAEVPQEQPQALPTPPTPPPPQEGQ